MFAPPDSLTTEELMITDALQQRPSLLDGEVHALHVHVELLVEQRLSTVCHGSELGDAGIRKQHIDLAELLRDGLVQPVQVTQFRHVAAHRDQVAADGFYCFVQRLLMATRDYDLSAFLTKPLGGRQADSTVTARHNGHFPCQFWHDRSCSRTHPRQNPGVLPRPAAS